LIHSEMRYCLWIRDDEVAQAAAIPPVNARMEGVRKFRASAKAPTTRPYAAFPNRFRQIQDVAREHSIIVPSHSSENRQYLPVGVLSERFIVSNAALVIYDAPLWNMALIASLLHRVWIATVCGQLETRFRYSNTLGWNTFPVPMLTEKNKADLTRCAEDIMLAREHHFPATIDDIYDPEAMPADLRAAHERNDEVLERIYIGRRFKNDTERLEKLFDLYTKMTASAAPAKGKKRKAGANA
ncbi:MAG TPA: lactate dehydrogenase, partial [Rhodocyclaceae bacterium]|nr:lactate dehydrogenase [Rhodocyclaceae bacterium]